MPPPKKFYKDTGGKEGDWSTGVSSKKSEFDKRFEAMKREAQHYIASWRSLSTYLNPTRGLFDETKIIRGTMIDHKVVLDSHATNSIRKTASGLNSGITSKSRPWFKLILADEAMMEYPNAKLWLEEVQKRMYTVLEGSNIYGTFQNTYEELLTFGTGCFVLLEDQDTVIRTRNYTAGEFYLGTDNKGKVNSFARSFEMTVAQIVKSFSYENCPPSVQSLWDTNQIDTQVRVRHLIEPNDQRDAKMADFKNMPFRSAYWIKGEQADDQFLDVRGYIRFPVVAPRWSVPTTDIVYGYGPGWDALGDVKELQKTKYDKLLAQEKLHNPPMQSDAHVDGHANLLPGGVTKTTANVPNAGLRPAYQINPAMESFIEIINSTKGAIDKHFLTDMFTMLASLDKRNMTATEVASREREIIMLMAPILNQMDEEMLSPVVELVFGIMLDNGLLPMPPEEMQGAEIKVQYISVLAQMQRSVGSIAIEKILAFVGNLAQLAPSALDLIDIDQTVREYGTNEGAPAKIINDPVVVDAIRDAQAQQQQQQMAMASAEPLSKSVKNLADAGLEGDSVLKRASEVMKP